MMYVSSTHIPGAVASESKEAVAALETKLGEAGNIERKGG